jgi:DNA-binding MarR family transcriptional regulator
MNGGISMANKTKIGKFNPIRGKPFNLLIAIKQSNQPYALRIAKQIDCTHSHTLKLLGKFEAEGYITRQESGRIRVINLTEKGERLATRFIELSRSMGIPQ